MSGPTEKAAPPSNGAADANNNDGQKGGKVPFAIYFMALLSVFGLISMIMAHSTGIHEEPLAHHQHKMILHQSKASLSKIKKEKAKHQTKASNRKTEKASSSSSSSQRKQEKASLPLDKQQDNDAPEALAGLRCDNHGGPSNDLAQEMVYWEDIPKDEAHQSPFYAPDRYLTFEPDHGGWNNIRMAMETVLAMAFAMGRTLVLPPAQEMYLLKKVHNNSKPNFSFAHFFDMPAIHAEHNGFDIITMEEFLQRQVNAEKPVLKALPPNKQTNWDGQAAQLNQYFQTNVRNLVWDPNRCIAYFPESPGHDTKSVEDLFHDIVNREKPKWEHFVGKPTPLNASTHDRLLEFTAQRIKLCLYNTQLQHEPVLHFPSNAKDPDDPKADSRLLVHFYAFLFFENYHQDLWMKRFVRDHVRYTDEIQCAGARVVSAMREKVRKVHGRDDGLFNTMHVRRGDFQYKKTRVSVQELEKVMNKVFAKGDVVFIATDERKKDFFEPLKARYHIYFLDDFIASGVVSKHINVNFYGMIDQLIASRGKLFIGCWFSTFTGYINRLRGYHSQRQKEQGYEEGKIRTSFYYAPPDRFDHMHEYYPIKQSFYAREFPTSWMLLNSDLEGQTVVDQR